MGAVAARACVECGHERDAEGRGARGPHMARGGVDREWPPTWTGRRARATLAVEYNGLLGAISVRSVDHTIALVCDLLPVRRPDRGGDPGQRQGCPARPVGVHDV